mmetsp:Transcript_1416/g.3189  ORF Transcript_1416/g.3189 Transcript_1416/m.3189 type:complete len:235 (+) Transcript_1416:2626-3330(+)
METTLTSLRHACHRTNETPESDGFLLSPASDANIDTSEAASQIRIIPAIVRVVTEDAGTQEHHLQREAKNQHIAKNTNCRRIVGLPLHRAYQGGLQDSAIAGAVRHGGLFDGAGMSTAPGDLQASVIEWRWRSLLPCCETLKALVAIHRAVHCASDQIKRSLLPIAPFWIYGQPVLLLEVHPVAREVPNGRPRAIFHVFIRNFDQWISSSIYRHRRSGLYVGLVQGLPHTRSGL